ncbi:MAG: winged helix-turn-helix transcriptional regulator [Candidatus Omnitrophota bacterium]
MDEREFELINIIGGELGANQRDISRQMELSLGMTNMLIRRLLSKGYIRIQQLNKKKVEYILTPQGFAEKMRKSVHYTMKTIHSIGLIKRRLSDVLVKAYGDGHRKYYILGSSDLAGLIEIVLKDKLKSGYEVVHVDQIAPAMADGVVLLCRENAGVPLDGLVVIDLINALANDASFIEKRVLVEGAAPIQGI